jgi:hypothetical protein
MRRIPISAGLFGCVMALALAPINQAVERGRESNTKPPQADQEAKDKETDKQHLLQIWKALMEYKKAKGQLPDYLSDLVPDYLPDKAVLLSPAKDARVRGKTDPRLPTSYAYEFRAEAFGNDGLTYREVKEEQMKEFGPVVPILRCFAHGNSLAREAMNISYSGDYFESQLYWEISKSAKELMAKLGMGPGFDDGDFTKLHLVSDETGKPIAGAEVRLTSRSFYALPLPDRTARTDAAGTVRVPLGPDKQPPSGRLTVTVFQPGFSGPKETWRQGVTPTTMTWRMKAASTIGGVVRRHDGAPVAGAQVWIFLPSEISPDAAAAVATNGGPPPDARALLPQLLEICTTDTEGRWRSEIVPKDFTTLQIQVRRSDLWSGVYRTTSEEDRAREPRSRPADSSTPNESGITDVPCAVLLAQKAEFRLAPAADLTVVLLGPDGSPLGAEEVTMSGHGAEPLDINGRSARPWATPYRLLPAKMKTNSNGELILKWPEAAELTFSATPKNLALVMRTVTVAPGMPPIKLKASRPRPITGRVRDTDGKPVEGVKVTFIGWAETTVDMPIAVTNEKGEFSWATAPAGQIGLTFQKRGLAQSTEWLPAEKKDLVEVELRLP